MPLDELNELDQQPKYSRNFSGVIGAMGHAHSSVKYLQLNVDIKELDNLGLVPEVPGSEKWPIRQLFQRDIDSERVETEIIPYFEQPDRVKFFNPLTIAALPLTGTNTVKSECQETEAEPYEGYQEAVCMEDYYRLSYNQRTGILEWNPSHVKLIAIDGQHRLSALKRLYDRYRKNPGDTKLSAVDFSSWRIPIVLVTVGHASGEGSEARVLDKTREIFVTINKQARQPSRSRTILLNDYSASAIAVQETIDGCREHGVPLALFNWRDSHLDSKSEGRTVYLLGVDELEDILINYLLGADEEADYSTPIALSGQQLENLYWEETLDPPDRYDLQALTDNLRNRYRETVFPAIVHLLKETKPIASFVTLLQSFESEDQSDVVQHAWSQIVYGRNYASDSVREQVAEERDKIIKQASDARRGMGPIFSRAVGIRSIFSGFSHFYEKYCQDVEICPQADAAKVFSNVFNALYTAGLFKADEATLNIVLDQNETIINYRIEHVHGAFGALVGFSVLSCYSQSSAHDLYDLEDAMLKRLRAEYRKQVRPDVKEDLAGRPNEEINKEVNDRAEKLALKQIKKFKRKLDKTIESIEKEN